MDALLLQKADLVLLVSQDVELQHFDKRVSILRSELDRKLKVVLCFRVVKVHVVPEVRHSKSRSLAPDLTRLRDFLECLIECVEDLIEVFDRVCTRMLELNKCGPQPSSGKVNLQRLTDQVFRFLEATSPDFEQDCLKVSLPLSLGDALGVRHNLPGAVRLASELEMLRVFEHGHGHLLLRDFVAASLNDLSGSLVLSDVELNSRGNQPDFPLDVVRAVLDRVVEEADGFLALALSFISLRSFNVDFPVQLARAVLEHFVQNSLEAVELLQSHLFGHLFI